MPPTCHDVDGNHEDFPFKIGVTLFPGFQNMEVFGPLDVFQCASCYIPKLEVYLLSHDLNPVSTKSPTYPNFGFEIKPTHTFSNPPPLDVLLIPGGEITRTWPYDPILTALRSFVADTYPKLKYLLTVGTGSALIAPTGILDYRKATTNKREWSWATSQGERVIWQLQGRWVVDGNIWTSCRMTAGIEMTLDWIKHVFDGREKHVISKNLVRGVGLLVATKMDYLRHMDPKWDSWDVPDITFEDITFEEEGNQEEENDEEKNDKEDDEGEREKILCTPRQLR